MNEDDLHRRRRDRSPARWRSRARQAGRQGRRLLARVGVRTYRSPFDRGIRPCRSPRCLVLDCGAGTFVVGSHGRCAARLRRLPRTSAVPCHGSARTKRAACPPPRPYDDGPATDRPCDGRRAAGDRSYEDVDRPRDSVSAAALTAALELGATRRVDLRGARPHSDRRPARPRALRHPKLLAVIEGSEVSREAIAGSTPLPGAEAAAGLPKPVTQAVLSRAKDRLVRVDCRYPGTRVVVELLAAIDGNAASKQVARDAERM